ncbi:hypothetical protein ACFLYC_02640 [Chloroflexota bacterium]
MDWAEIISGLVAVLVFAIGLPLALRKRKQGGVQKTEELLHHLQDIGVKASQVERGGDEAKIGIGHSFTRKSVGVIEIAGRNIDYVNVTGVTSQYGVNYFLDYLIKSPGWSGTRRRKKTRMVRRKSPPIWGKVVDIEWKGDDYLSQHLNLDYQLKDKLLQTELKSNIEISPEPKYEYTRVRTTYLLPPPDLLEAIDIIAKYIKSG